MSTIFGQWSFHEVKTLFKHINETESSQTQEKRWNPLILAGILPFKSIEICKRDYEELTKLFRYNPESDVLEKINTKIAGFANTTLLKAPDQKNEQIYFHYQRWTEEEDEKLLLVVRSQVKSTHFSGKEYWNEVAKHLPHRTADSCKRRLYNLNSKSSSEDDAQICEELSSPVKSQTTVEKTALKKTVQRHHPYERTSAALKGFGQSEILIYPPHGSEFETVPEFKNKDFYFKRNVTVQITPFSPLMENLNPNSSLKATPRSSTNPLVSEKDQFVEYLKQIEKEYQ
jgi:hypothetical protein